MKLEFPKYTDLTNKIEERIEGIEVWIEQEGSNCKQEQAHLLKGTKEKIYWHYGYLIALKDILRLLGEDFKNHRQGKYN